MQYQEIIIAADDISGAATDGQLQEFVILGVSARADLFCWLDKECSFDKGRQEFLALRCCHISLEFRALEHLGQFLCSRCRQQHSTACEGVTKGLSRS